MKNKNSPNPFVELTLVTVGVAFVLWVYIGIQRSNSADRFQKNIAEYNAEELRQQTEAESYRNRPRY